LLVIKLIVIAVVKAESVFDLVSLQLIVEDALALL
jgi:hypothetical protein